MGHGSYPPVERIDLGGGQFWEVYTVVTRGMRKAFRDAGLRAFLRGLGDGAQADWTKPEDLQRVVAAHPEAWDLNAVDDAYLLHGTHTWSFEEAVTLEVIDSIAAETVDRVLARMRELYAEPTEETVKK